MSPERRDLSFDVSHCISFYSLVNGHERDEERRKEADEEERLRKGPTRNCGLAATDASGRWWGGPLAGGG